MSRILREYGFVLLLGLGIAVPAFGPRAIDALTLPTQNFAELQKVDTVAAQLRETPEQAQELTQSLISASLQKSGIAGDVDVAAIVEKGDLASIARLEGVTPLQQQALVENVRSTYVSSAMLLDTAKLLSAKSAMIHQPGDGEGGGFGGAVQSALTNSSQDVLTDLQQYQDQLDQTTKQLKEIEKYWKLLQVVLAAKPAFLPEKADNDTFVTCVNHVGPPQLYPSLYESLDIDFTQLNQQYASILDEVNGSVQKATNITGRLTDLTASPLSAVEIAVAEQGEYTKLLDAATAVVGGSTTSLSQQLAAQYGGSIASSEDLGHIQDALAAGENLTGAADRLDEVSARIGSELATRNTELLADLEANGDAASLQAVGNALGSDGAALTARYQSLVASRGRATDTAAVDTALASLRGQMQQQLAMRSNGIVAQVQDARDVASTFGGKSPTELIASAEAAEKRVADRAEDNLTNATQTVSRLTNLENYKQTISAELDTWTSQEQDFSYITNLTAILGLTEQLKPPTT